MAAATGGRKAADMYRRGLNADSSVYDLYFGLGLYHYWKSSRGGVLRWLGLLEDDRDKGIRQLRLAADSSLLSGGAARSSLILVYLDDGRWDEARELAAAMHRAYPVGWSFLWPLAFACYHADRWEEAVAAFSELRLRLAREPGNYFNLIECDYFLAHSYRELKREADIEAVARRVRAYADSIPEETAKRQEDRLEFLLDIDARSFSSGDEDL
jgi:hypothetical protein